MRSIILLLVALSLLVSLLMPVFACGSTMLSDLVCIGLAMNVLFEENRWC
ncbi:hypothetical protein [Enterococcus sp. AZ196]